MSMTVKSIYEISRERAGLTQEAAAERLDISVRTLARYESGERRPSDEAVIKMIALYNEDRLACDYISESKVGRTILPSVKNRSMTSAFLTLQKEIKDITLLYDEIIEIICDGEVTEAEKKRYEKFMKELEELLGAGLSMKFAKKG